MFGLSEAHYNIVKRTCNELQKELQTALDGGAKYDHVAASTISKHYEKVKTLVTKTQFIWLAGYLRGRWGIQGQYE